MRLKRSINAFWDGVPGWSYYMVMPRALLEVVSVPDQNPGLLSQRIARGEPCCAMSSPKTAMTR